MKIFSVYDCKSESYARPFFEKTAALAIRAFEIVANEQGHQFNKYGEDYTLFEIGEYDEANAYIKAYAVLLPLGNALEMRRDTSEENQDQLEMFQTAIDDIKDCLTSQMGMIKRLQKGNK